MRPLSPSPLNVATPDALVDAVPDPTSDAPPLGEAATVTPAPTALPCASLTSTTGCVVNAAPLAAPEGSVWIVTCAGAPGASANVPDVAGDRGADVNESVKLPAVPLIPRSENVARPEPLVFVVVVPIRLPVPLVIP